MHRVAPFPKSSGASVCCNGNWARCTHLSVHPCLDCFWEYLRALQQRGSLPPETTVASSRQNEVLDCPVCYTHFRDPQLIATCGHTLCRDCADRLLLTRRCWCQKPFQAGDVSPNRELAMVMIAFTIANKTPNYALAAVLESWLGGLREASCVANHSQEAGSVRKQ